MLTLAITCNCGFELRANCSSLRLVGNMWRYRHVLLRVGSMCVTQGTILFTVLAGVLFAQFAPLSGVVRLHGGLGIGGAKVSASCTQKSTYTDEYGAFTLSGVSP